MSEAVAGKRVAVGMSGGVDSSLAAWLLRQAGYDVIGVFIRCWEDDGRCPAGADATAAAAAATAIGIELETVDFGAAYQSRVFAGFIAELRAGRTPNPDLWCNAEVKFTLFPRYAREHFGAELIATGHYAQTTPADQRLAKAEDENKDQTYFLYRLSADQLARACFPIGGMLKSEVRRAARAAHLPTANRPESMGICFVGKRSFRDFVGNFLPPQTGALVDAAGTEVGEHDGAHFYTIGQRAGLGLGGAGAPWYVAAKDMAANSVTVVRGRDHPLLLTRSVRVAQLSWLAGTPPADGWVYSCRLRHRMEPAPCTWQGIDADGTAVISFAQSQWGVAPGQAAVMYDGKFCLGGGTIMATVI